MSTPTLSGRTVGGGTADALRRALAFRPASHPASHLGPVAHESEILRAARQLALFLSRHRLAPMVSDASARWSHGVITLTGRTVPAPADTFATTHAAEIRIEPVGARVLVTVGIDRSVLVSSLASGSRIRQAA